VICVVFLTNVHELVIKMNVTNMHGGRIKTNIKQNCAPSWIYLQDYTGMHGQQNIK